MTAATLLKKLVAMGGLFLTAPVAYLLVTGELTLADAGVRAGMLFVAVMVFRSIAGMFPSGTVVVAQDE
jgi:hypothetical protein